MKRKPKGRRPPRGTFRHPAIPRGTFFLCLFHGRSSRTEQPEDWGFDGPVIGPLGYISWTYGGLRFGNVAGDSDFDLPTPGPHHDLVEVAGRYYGDFTILSDAEVRTFKPGERRRLMTFDEFNQVLHYEHCPTYEI